MSQSGLLKKDETVDISGARVLTEEKCAALLNEKKENRRLLAEQKKKEKMKKRAAVALRKDQMLALSKMQLVILQDRKNM